MYLSFSFLWVTNKIRSRNQIRERKNPRSPRLDWWERIQRPKANWRESLIGLFTKSKKLWNQPKQTTKHNSLAVGWNSDEGLTWKVKMQREREGDWPSRTELRERRPPPRNDNWHLIVTGEECRAANLGGQPLTKLAKELLGSGLERESERL